MNEEVSKRLHEIGLRLDALAEALASADKTAAEQNDQRQQLLQEQFRQRKEIVTLQHKGERFDQVKQENEALAKVHSDLRTRLREILTMTRALATELRQ